MPDASRNLTPLREIARPNRLDLKNFLYAHSVSLKNENNNNYIFTLKHYLAFNKKNPLILSIKI